MSSNMLFLLGGYDLEMIEIKKILDENSIKYIDKKLSWGAKLSDYKDSISKYQDFTIYGIELEEDIDTPKNYIEIDHHNENSNKPSSIEQVSEILSITLSRDQMLIAKNDSSFIDGMRSICATQKEIDNTRTLDRDAQGITKKDEELAMQSIKESKDNNTFYSHTSHFTAISDRISGKYETYIIYNDHKVVFYGHKIKNTINFLTKQNISKSSYYYGGGDFGFLGIKDNVLDKKQIENLIKEFL